MNQPTFFLSSTIFDFSDLRSAIKYYLESQGAKVLASEYNDFEKNLDKHSYQACLGAISSADYYVLLIGTRVGGWYDQENKVSITQQEYRVAYDLHKQGKIKLIIFVRESIWQFKNDRKMLENYLSKIDIESDLRNEIVTHSTKNISDASFVIDFIKEVERIDETKTALQEGSSLPTANWIHSFKGFDEILDVLKIQVFSGLAKEHSLVRELLYAEFCGLLKQTLIKSNTKNILSPVITVRNFHSDHYLTIDENVYSSINVEKSKWNSILFITVKILGQKLLTKTLENSLLTNTFLTFSVEDGCYVKTKFHEYLLILQNEIIIFNECNNDKITSIIFENIDKNKASTESFVEINNTRLLSLIHLLDRWVNIVELLRSLVLFLNDKEKSLDLNSFTPPALQPASPIRGMSDQIERESISTEELDSFLFST